jgi:hypothetical protein
MPKSAYLIFVTAMSAAPWACGQSGDARDLLQVRLNAQFALTTITADRSDIVTPGAVLVLQRKGLVLYSIASPLPPLNTYKNGRISQGGSAFGRDVLISIATPGGATAANYPHRPFAIEEGLWLTGLTVQKDGIVFLLYSDAYDGVRYYGQLKFPFQKGSVPTPEQALTTIAEVLALKPANTNEQVAAPTPPPLDVPPPPPGEPAEVKVGQTQEQVVAAFGQPFKKAKTSTKEIYFYKDMKVTFVDGKVADVE